MLKLSFKPVIMFLREWKEPRGRIITPLRQFQIWTFSRLEDYYDLTVSVWFYFIMFMIYKKTRCFTETLNGSPEQAKSDARGEEKLQDQADTGAPAR